MENLFEKSFFLTPAECNPQQRMPITLLINRLIEVATLHANQINIGYEYLKQFNRTWVLSRVATEMKRYPGVNENYTVRTWMVSINRLFSERNFDILDGEGNIIGGAHTVWAVLNVETRQATDLSDMYHISDQFLPNFPCPAAPLSRLRPLKEFEVIPYRFTYCDLDFNRHVNSSRYIELLLNCRSLQFHDANRLNRFEINYLHEAYYDEPVEVRLSEQSAPAEGSTLTHAEIIHEDRPIVRAILAYSPR